MRTENYCGISPFTDEEIKSIIKNEADAMDAETTINFISDLVEADKADTEGYTPIEKIMWLMRNAYLSGLLRGIETYNDAVKSVLEKNCRFSHNANK